MSDEAEFEPVESDEALEPVPAGKLIGSAPAGAEPREGSGGAAGEADQAKETESAEEQPDAPLGAAASGTSADPGAARTNTPTPEPAPDEVPAMLGAPDPSVTPQPDEPEPTDTRPRVVVEGLSVGPLSGVSFQVPPGVTALLGSAGAGKTALIRALLGLEPYAGKATVLGHDARKHALWIRENVGYVPEDPVFPRDMSGVQLARFLDDVYPSWSSSRFYDLLGRLGVPAKPAIDTLYPAVRARLALGAALAIDPKLLVVDVPGLDPRGRADLLLGLREERGERTVLVACAHTRELASFADQVVILAGGAARYAGPRAGLGESLEQAYLEVPNS